MSVAAVIACMAMHAADPTATNYTLDECQGSFMPYPVPGRPYDAPDSLTAVFVNHVGLPGVGQECAHDT